jgi:hypothetical protein
MGALYCSCATTEGPDVADALKCTPLLPLRCCVWSCVQAITLSQPALLMARP